MIRFFKSAVGFFNLEQTDYWTARVMVRRSLKGRFGNYSLHLEARDLGSPVNKIETTLNVCVLDYNDNPPVFVSPQHNTTIRVPEVGKIYFQESLNSRRNRRTLIRMP